MSTTVLVIAEDPRNDEYLLRPIAEAVLAEAGRPRARIQVLMDPRLRGYDAALRTIRGDLNVRYGYKDLWLFFPDADRASPEAMATLERSLRDKGVTLFCCPAEPEVEIYACAAYLPATPGAFREWKSHPRLKEDVFNPLLRKHGDPKSPGGGRRSMIRKALGRRRQFFQIFPEIAALRDRIIAHLAD